MSALLITLSVFPFTFAALMALWSFALLVRAIKASLRGAESSFELALGSVATAGITCVFGMVGFSVLQQVSP